jgi:hypothetical protein
VKTAFGTVLVSPASFFYVGNKELGNKTCHFNRGPRATKWGHPTQLLPDLGYLPLLFAHAFQWEEVASNSSAAFTPNKQYQQPPTKHFIINDREHRTRAADNCSCCHAQLLHR